MNFIKTFIKSNPAVSKVLSLVYNFRSSWKPPITDIKKLTNKLLKNNEPVFFVQIGANDGISGCDHIRQNVLEKGWRGILVEPVPHIFGKLVKNYEGWQGLHFENAGVGSLEGTQTFYHFDESMSSWHNELGSFKKEVLYRHGIADADNIIKETEVPVVTVTSLLKKYQVHKVDMLNIDTEGYDYEILKTIDFDFIKPRLIIFEHRHLSGDDYKQSLQLLKSHRYDLYSEHDADTIAVLKN